MVELNVDEPGVLQGCAHHDKTPGAAAEAATRRVRAEDERIDALEREVAELRGKVSALKEEMAASNAQFE